MEFDNLNYITHQKPILTEPMLRKLLKIHQEYFLSNGSNGRRILKTNYIEHFTKVNLINQRASRNGTYAYCLIMPEVTYLQQIVNFREVCFENFIFVQLGIIPTDFGENRLYLSRYLDINYGVKKASGKCGTLFFPQKCPNRPQIKFKGRVFHEISFF